MNTQPPRITPRLDGRYDRVAALPVASWLIDELDDTAQQITVAGSIRRKKHTVKDVEIVVMTDDSRNLLARLDNMVASGRVRKAVYTDKNGKQSHRWGDKYRGVEVSGIKCEIFVATPDNHGYILWLRTGPGDANHYAVKYLLPPDVTLSGGYGYHFGKRFAIRTERAMFNVLRLPFYAPEFRTLDMYTRASGRQNRRHADVQYDYLPDDPAPPAQPSLFGD